ncbi:hypothetical protein GCM10027181_05540 [Rheinheimera gaetbuli]
MVYTPQVLADMFSWFKKYDVHLSPVVQGKITLDGKPLAGIKVFRELDYDKSYNDEVVTDEQGQFYFAEKNIKSRLPGNKFDQSKSRQVLSLDYQGKLFLLWYLNTSSIKPQQAVVQRLASLNCDLSNEELEQVFPNFEKPDFPHSTFSICRWPD